MEVDYGLIIIFDTCRGSWIIKDNKNTVYELIKRGELPSYKVGKKIRVDTKDVEEYINSQKLVK